MNRETIILKSYQRKINERFDKLIERVNPRTAQEKRAYTLAYNGVRKELKKVLNFVLPVWGFGLKKD